MPMPLSLSLSVSVSKVKEFMLFFFFWFYFDLLGLSGAEIISSFWKSLRDLILIVSCRGGMLLMWYLKLFRCHQIQEIYLLSQHGTYAPCLFIFFIFPWLNIFSTVIAFSDFNCYCRQDIANQLIKCLEDEEILIRKQAADLLPCVG